MSVDKLARGMQDAILAEAPRKLGRELTQREKDFVVSRGGYIALESILDTVKAYTPPEIERYLNSESRS